MECCTDSPAQNEEKGLEGPKEKRFLQSCKRSAKSIRTLRFVLIGICVFFGGLQTYFARHFMGIDTISYMDVGAAFVRGDWSRALSGYWGVVFPWTIGIVVRITHTQGIAQFEVAHLLQFVFFLLDLFLFGRFWCAVIAVLPERFNTFPVKAWALYLGYSAFVFSFVPMLTAITPDLLLSAVILSIGLSLWKFALTAQSHWLLAVGCLLGFGYLVKSIMFPVGLVTLLMAGVTLLLQRRSLKPVVCAGLAFLMICAPLILALSKRAEHLTFGDSGRLNYAWFASLRRADTDFLASRSFFPLGQLISTNPKIYKIETKAFVTFWPWFDPGALTKDVHPTFNLRNQAVRLAGSLQNYRNLVLLEGHAYLLMAIVLFFSLHPLKFRARELFGYLPLFAFALSALGGYALVLVEPRYINAFACLLVGTLLGLSLKTIRNGDSIFASRVLIVAAILFTAQAIPTLMIRVMSPAKDETSNTQQAKVARALEQTGLTAGESVAVINWPYYEYWPKLVNASVSAYIPTPEITDFCRSGQGPSEETLEAIKSTGARWLVTSAITSECPRDGWQMVPETPYRFRKLQQ